MLRPQVTRAIARLYDAMPKPMWTAPVARVRSTDFQRDGFTLVEILVATVLTLILMGMVVTVFGTVTEEISNSRASIETADRLRSTQLLLQRDLSGTTARMVPPLRPEENLGYFEYIEGPIGPVLPLRPSNGGDGYDILGASVGNDLDIPGTTLGDFDDVLMFTTRNMETPFRGIANGQSISSPVAEVIWFLRGTTLYRRVLLVAPTLETRINDSTDSLYDANAFTTSGFYGKYDLSARQVGGPNDLNASSPATGFLKLNTLGDLTKRENRYGHQPWVYPHDARFWGLLGMPTLQECSFFENVGTPTTGLWPFPLQGGSADYDSTQTVTIGGFTLQLIRPIQRYDMMTAVPMPITSITSGATTQVPDYANDHVAEQFRHEETLTDGFDPWFNSIPWNDVDSQTGTLIAYDLGDNADGYYNNPGNAGSTRIAEDVVLTNVLSFDVKIWDPGAPVLEHEATTNNFVAVLPGDPGYIELLRSVLLGTDTTTHIASFGAYVDLNYMSRLSAIGLQPDYDLSKTVMLQDDSTTATIEQIGGKFPWFHGPGDPRSHLMGSLPSTSQTITAARAAVYDTWSTHYEYDGINQDGDDLTDEGTDGFDNWVEAPATSVYDHTPTNSGLGTEALQNGIDDFNELEATPPYASPMKGLQITIRVFEPDSRQIREVTIVQDFQAEESGTNYE